MIFAATAFLLALPLAAAPLVLHLLDRRRNLAINWGAMEFLVEASARQTSSRKLKQWTLLLLRILAIAALIFALARPLVSTKWLGGSDRTETILVIDNSMSTGRTNGDTTLMQTILQRARDQLAKLTPGDRVRILTTAPYPIWQGSAKSRNGGMRFDPNSSAVIQQTLQGIAPTGARSDLLAGLLTATQADVPPSTRQRQIVLLTDSQATDWRMDDVEGWNHFRQRLSKPTIDTSLEIIQVDRTSPSKGNTAIDHIRARRTRVGVDEPVTLTATVRNHQATATTSSKNVVWKVDGEHLYDGLVDPIDAGASQETTWTHSFDTPGVYRVAASMQAEDDLAADDSAGLVIEVVTEVPVLIVESESRLADTQQDSFFVRAALGWLDEQPDNGRCVFVPTVVDQDRIASTDLDQFHAIVIPSLTRLDRDAVSALSQFVDAGGGLWVALGPRTDIDEFNAQWFASGSGLSPVAVDRIVSEATTDLASENSSDNDSPTADPIDASTRRPPVTINPFGSRHVAVSQLADNQQLDLGEVTVDQRFRFSVDASDNQTSVLLSLSNGEPVAVEQLLGRGRTFILAIPLRMQWSDLVRSQSYVVMVRDWIEYLAEPRATKFNLQPGDPLVYRANDLGREVDGSMTGVLSTPQDESIELSADGFGDMVLRTSRTSLPGAYQLETNLLGDAIPFHVARDARESDLSVLDAGEQKKLSQLTGIKTSTNGQMATETEPTDPLWPYILMGLIALITLELLLSGILARERFGVEGVAASSSDIEAEYLIPETKFPATATSMPPVSKSIPASRPQENEVVA